VRARKPAKNEFMHDVIMPYLDTFQMDSTTIKSIHYLNDSGFFSYIVKFVNGYTLRFVCDNWGYCCETITTYISLDSLSSSNRTYIFDIDHKLAELTDVSPLINVNLLMTSQIDGIKLYDKCSNDGDSLFLRFTSGAEAINASITFTNSNPLYGHAITCTITNSDNETIYYTFTML
jgi:hypothetical protein